MKGKPILLCMLAVLLLWSGWCAASSPRTKQEKSVVEQGAEHKDGDRIRVTFINPGISDPKNPTGGFWLSVSAFMYAVAEQLDIDLEVIYSERDHIRMQRQVREVVSRPVHPDYLIVVNEKLAADEMVRTADRAGIKVFVMLNTFVGDQAESMGLPRKKYSHWIGSLIPNNRLAGYLIAKQIIEAAQLQGKTKNRLLKVFAIAGDPVTQASVERVDGLWQAVGEYPPKAEVEQVFFGQWRTDNAMQKTQLALLRYPETRAIWAANDPMAIGAIRGAIAAQRTPGQDIFIGGLNWDKAALNRIKDGSLAISVGGHFMTGGWTLILLYDYHHGKDFIDEGAALQCPIFGALTRKNIETFLAKFGDRDWTQIDFKKFSKVLNPGLRHYNFSAEAVIAP
ncbi:ABC transporter substrate-binding protein [Desulfobulbus rhabdoformis]|uniref:ABC transporter substrate-binding protein n=1 Tax=Desulfobulbus rhabdoformis TaxID=34032 RepID=UPI001964EED1|nr:ABC transporter substrate-binding protein [Desulfobulbus rhabdoformis]MBM9614551.1 ABC transporter substrate-binding protein [Desulfobulbus rhabdoformis]